MHAFMRLLTAFIALEVWVPLIVAENKSLIAHEANGLTPVQEQAILDIHNEKRALEPASDMVRMVWDPVIAKSAQDYANQCVPFKSDDKVRESVQGYDHLGEIVTTLYNNKEVTTPVTTWYSQRKGFDYNTSKCESSCRKFKQLVWAKTRVLGCGVKWCSFMVAHNFVCRYGPGAPVDVGGEPENPYTKGEKCSKCPEDQRRCVNGMCSQPAGEEKEEVKKEGNEENDEESSKTRASNDGSLLRASYSMLILLSWATLAQIVHY